MSCDGRTDEDSLPTIAAVETPNVIHVARANENPQVLTVAPVDDEIREIRLLPGSGEALTLRESGRLSRIHLGTGSLVADCGLCNAIALVEGRNELWLGERGTGNGLICIDLSTWQKLQHFSAHRSTIRALAVSPDESMLVSTGNDRSVALWETSTGELIRRFESLPHNGVGIGWSPDGLTIAVCCDESTVHLFQAATLREMGILYRGHESIYNVLFTADSQWLIATDAYLQAWALDGRPPDTR